MSASLSNLGVPVVPATAGPLPATSVSPADLAAFNAAASASGPIPAGILTMNRLADSIAQGVAMGVEAGIKAGTPSAGGLVQALPASPPLAVSELAVTPIAGVAPPAPAASAAPPSAQPSLSQAGLAVNGNVVDTGRYVISASNAYTRPTDGGKAADGMLSIYDKQTKSYVDVYGDPHVYTSAGDQANFMANGMTLTLGDGTKVEIEPTTVKNGVSYIGGAAITKDNQTVVQSGFASGTVSTSAVAQGGPSTGQGFNNTKDAVLSAGADGSLGTLFGPSGTALNSKAAQQSLDGTFTAPGTSGPATAKEVAALQQLISTLQQQISATGGSAASQQMISQMEQLVSSLLSGSGADMATMNNTLLPSLEQVFGQLGASGQGASVEASQINQVISAMMDGAGAGSAAAPAGGTAPTAAGPSNGQPAASGTASSSPSFGISGAEIDAMLASINNTGPAYNFADWHQTSASYTASTPNSSNQNSTAAVNGKST